MPPKVGSNQMNMYIMQRAASSMDHFYMYTNYLYMSSTWTTGHPSIA